MKMRNRKHLKHSTKLQSQMLFTSHDDESVRRHVRRVCMKSIAVKKADTKKMRARKKYNFENRSPRMRQKLHITVSQNFVPERSGWVIRPL